MYNDEAFEYSSHTTNAQYAAPVDDDYIDDFELSPPTQSYPERDQWDDEIGDYMRDIL